MLHTWQYQPTRTTLRFYTIVFITIRWREWRSKKIIYSRQVSEEQINKIKEQIDFISSSYSRFYNSLTIEHPIFFVLCTIQKFDNFPKNKTPCSTSKLTNFIISFGMFQCVNLHSLFLRSKFVLVGQQICFPLLLSLLVLCDPLRSFVYLLHSLRVKPGEDWAGGAVDNNPMGRATWLSTAVKISDSSDRGCSFSAPLAALKRSPTPCPRLTFDRWSYERPCVGKFFPTFLT